MNRLDKHIEILLLENDCVIVPGLGGFITHYQPARYAEAEQVYLPPLRTIGFNPQLTMNDGLLAQSYMQVYHTDFPDATRRIDNEVKQLKETLYKEGRAELRGVGELCYTLHGSYEFHPSRQGVSSPMLYGLEPVNVARLNPIPVPRHHQHSPKVPAERHISIPLNSRWLGNAVAVAVAVVLFFFLSVPVENTYIDKGNYASLGTDGLLDAIRSQSLATTVITLPVDADQQPQRNKKGRNDLKPVTVKVEKVAAPAKAQADKPAPEQEERQPATAPAPPKEEAQPAASREPSNRYYIIVSSLATAADARQTLDAYKQKGYKTAKVIEGNGRYRLALCGFPDKAAAYNKLNELKKENAFKNAWVLNAK